MKRSYIRSVCLDEDTAKAFNAAQEKLRMSGSEIVNRLIMEWVLAKDPGTIMPACPSVPIAATVLQRATEIANREKALKKKP